MIFTIWKPALIERSIEC